MKTFTTMFKDNLLDLLEKTLPMLITFVCLIAPLLIMDNFKDLHISLKIAAFPTFWLLIPTIIISVFEYLGNKL